jgi:hypothetical protein
LIPLQGTNNCGGKGLKLLVVKDYWGKQSLDADVSSIPSDG